MTAENGGEPVGSGGPDRKGSIRERILAAAVRLFGELGYTETTMERIAAEAGVARATVFNNYASKEKLFDAVASTHYVGFADCLRAENDPDLELRVRLDNALARWSSSFATHVDAVIPVVHSWVHAGGPLLPGSDATADLLAEMIGAEQAAGRLGSERSPIVMGRAASDALTGTLLRWTTDSNPTAESLSEALIATADAIRFE
ncbi:TetR/AcrR family transcriptional regulator [Williamsia phyllosphaerae]|uniref:TetR family transcriptional regulator n=1 Tax=Williamsia phyllosphaerae TaxID=885042 RepID=A0ABQ1UFJ7_9NOCA|nr:TetR/AcrR family transcriptional regulator [Williamsia phyllosphaerae]GGF16881.1 TetR family transcriptional regulator [Williamsia phyllosphaerae]